MLYKLRLLTKPNVFLLVSGLFVSMLLSTIYGISAAIHITNLTNRFVFLGGYLSIPFIINIFLSPIAGGICDKLSRKWVVVICDILSGINMFVIFYFYNLYNSPNVLFIGFISLSTISIFFENAIFGLVKEVCNKDELYNMNALITLVMYTTKTVGLFSGAFFISKISLSTIIFINALSFLISAFFEFFIRTDKSIIRDDAKLIDLISNLNIRNNFKEFINNKILAQLLGVTIITSLIYNGLVKILYLTTYATIGMETFYSILLIAITLAPILTTIFFSIKNKSYETTFKRFTILGITAFLISNILLVFGNLLVFKIAQVILVFMASMGMVQSAILTSSLLHENSSINNVSSFNAFFKTIAHLFTPLFLITYGYILDIGYIYGFYLIVFLSAGGIMLTLKFSLNEEYRSFDKEAPNECKPTK